MEEKILDLLKKEGKPLRPSEIAEKIGADSKEVSKILQKLKKDGKVESPKRCYYSIKEV
ncbi:MAG: winged helix-turn-helix domain-containing protein [Candidatus Hydrothermales bacterium]